MRRADVKELRRQQLIEATIAAIAKRGFAGTTLADVARGAGLSHGIVNFYFKSKEALLVATLEHLAAEYEAFWTAAVARAGGAPAATLQAMIEADFDPTIASRKKVAVWHAFWAEGRARPEYRRLCNALDATYHAQARDLCQAIIERGGYDKLDADTIATGLTAMSDGLWHNLLLAKNFDRERAKAVCRSYLASVFPNEFGGGARSAA